MEILSKNEGVKHIAPGMITYVVMARCCSSEPHRLVASSVGCAIPSDSNAYGYLSEHHAFGQSEKVAGDMAEYLAVSMLASTLGIDVDEEDDKKLNAQEHEVMLKDKIVRTSSITQTSIVNPDGRYTTVVAAAVFLF
jgi:arginine decarboxylase